MGDGQGLKGKNLTFGLDVETTSLTSGGSITEQDLENMITQVQASFGKPHVVMMNPIIFNMNSTMYSWNPQYSPTAWTEFYRLTVREHKVAILHTILAKLNIHDVSSADQADELVRLCKTRLKKAKWARYQKPKVKSSP